MKTIISVFFSNSRQSLCQLLLLLGCMAIASAWFMEYVLQWTPCQMCIWQRWGWYSVIALAIMGWPIKWSKETVLIGITLALLSIFFSIFIAFWHHGIQVGWFEPLASCNVVEKLPTSPNQLLQNLALSTRVPGCDKQVFAIMGAGLPFWHMTWAILCAILVTAGLLGYKRAV